MNSITDPIIHSVYSNLKKRYTSTSQNFAILKLYVRGDELKLEYENRVKDHNLNIINNKFIDSGFDLLIPERTVFDRDVESKFINLNIKTEMVYCDINRDIITNCAFLVHPRSSISKTPLMLANHTGIIDSGYRGSLIGAFRWLKSASSNEPEYIVDKHSRLLQICHPSLCPVFIVFVDEKSLSNTERGSNGFGSTGV